MDVLSDVMTVLRTGRPIAARFARVAPWANRRPAHPGGFGVQIMVRGSAVLTTESGRTLRLEEGDALLLPLGGAHVIADSHGSEPDPPCESGPLLSGAVFRSDVEGATHVALCMAYELAPGRSHPLIADLPDLVHLPADATARPEVAAAVALLDEELRVERGGGDTLVHALVDAILMYLLRAMLGNSSLGCRFGGWGDALADRSVGGALTAIHADPARQWTVAALGEVAGLSRSAFSRRFTDLVGQPPLGYLTMWRLTLAARLLSDGDAPLSSVARQVGYASEFAFAAAFKREFGRPPGRFRKEAPACERVPAALRAEPVADFGAVLEKAGA
ncbi:AraC family transcriptional regulator [Glycomyces paridis]|uniref:AraC family transcriptional regulator n=1 Tax=Glycomyces paridis TaxID=2126555 RepID=A0A4S8P4E1_9ACTN|nr:AraC family transcriptional regulator [Glycomyces paridis]THV24321.1 AraC family transcriptional regulator [Glycomyces paridis]